MKAAVVHSAGQAPVCADFEPPLIKPGQQLIRVKAAAVTQLTRIRASGKHYSAGSPYPIVAGVDGVGLLADGSRVYFANTHAPYGAMAEHVVLALEQLVPIPDDIDDITAAALPNPGLSGWMALRERAAFQAGETVLVNGATGASGSLAVQIARYFGAKRIIATGRNPQVLSGLRKLGADQLISLVADESEQQKAFEEAFESGIDIVLDYLWGPSARMILAASSRISDPARPMRFVQIGSMAGAEMSLSVNMLRSRANLLMGSGFGSVAPDRVLASVKGVLDCARDAGLQIATETAALSDITRAWSRNTGRRRLVITV